MSDGPLRDENENWLPVVSKPSRFTSARVQRNEEVKRDALLTCQPGLLRPARR
jgi:hypothetical protein